MVAVSVSCSCFKLSRTRFPVCEKFCSSAGTLSIVQLTYLTLHRGKTRVLTWKNRGTQSLSLFTCTGNTELLLSPWLKLCSQAWFPRGSGPCFSCSHRMNHRLRKWKMFLCMCSRWVQTFSVTVHVCDGLMCEIKDASGELCSGWKKNKSKALLW